MAAGERDVHRILEQLHGAQAGAERLADVTELEQQREVELARPQARHDLLRLTLRQRQLDLGMRGPEVGDRERHEGVAGGRERGHPQAAAAHPENRRELGLGRLDAGQDRLRVHNQRRAGGGRAHAPAIALDQLRAGLGLQRGDGLRDRRLRVAERVGRRGEGAARGHLPEHPQTLHVQHKQR